MTEEKKKKTPQQMCVVEIQRVRIWMASECRGGRRQAESRFYCSVFTKSDDNIMR